MNDQGGRGDPRKESRSARHGAHADMLSEFQRRFWTSLVLTAPVVLLSSMIQRALGLECLASPGRGSSSSLSRARLLPRRMALLRPPLPRAFLRGEA